MTPTPRTRLDLGGLLGAPEDTVHDRLGEPLTARSVGGERWLVYRRGRTSLRLRLRPDAAGRPVVRSWTATFARGHATLEGACEAVGVSPAEGDELDASLRSPEPGGAMIRRRLPDVSTREVHSLSARTRAGRIVSLTAFDEPPDWRRGHGAP